LDDGVDHGEEALRFEDVRERVEECGKIAPPGGRLRKVRRADLVRPKRQRHRPDSTRIDAVAHGRSVVVMRQGLMAYFSPGVYRSSCSCIVPIDIFVFTSTIRRCSSSV